MEKRSPKIIEWIINEEVGDNVDVISIVDHPAIEIDFLKFSSDKKMIFKTADEEKRIIIGAAMIPNKYIYRYDSFTDEEYYGFFSEQTIEKSMELFMKNGSTKSTNLNHNSKFFDGVSVIESWQVVDENNDKAYALGYSNKDVPKGTWMVSMKVDNDEVWQSIKNGTYKGFSIEAFLSQVTKMRKESSVENDLMQIVKSNMTTMEKAEAMAEYIIRLKLND